MGNYEKERCSFYMAKYTIEFKKQAVKHCESNGFHDTLRVYNISKTALTKWQQQMERDDFMRKETKKYTVAEKIDIIKHYEENGQTATERKYNISVSVFRKWIEIVEEFGIEALGKDSRKGNKRPKKHINPDEDIMAELKRLRIENMYLKKLKALVEKREEQGTKNK